MGAVEQATLWVANAITLLHLLGTFMDELARVIRRVKKVYRMFSA